MQKKLQKIANFQVYPTNLANPGRIGTKRMTLNIIFVLIILTYAQGFESIKKYGGQGPLAAPYRILLCPNRFLIDHVATKLAQFCHIFLGQSVFLIGPHNAASLGCWPGS